jgi:hypothetical protein
VLTHTVSIADNDTVAAASPAAAASAVTEETEAAGTPESEGTQGAAVPSQTGPERVWRNAVEPCDVDNDAYVSPLDALLVINYLNAGDSGGTAGYVDVSGDGLVSALDALLVINRLNTQAESGLAAGESTSAAAGPGLPAVAMAAGVPPAGTSAQPADAVPQPVATAPQRPHGDAVAEHTATPLSVDTSPPWFPEDGMPALEEDWENLLDGLAADVTPVWSATEVAA